MRHLLFSLLFPCCVAFLPSRSDASTPPVIVCQPPLSVNIGSTGTITIWIFDLIDTAYDAETAENMLVFSMRMAGTGTDFPSTVTGDPILSLMLDCCDLGLQEIELWVRDTDGNTAFCTMLLIVQSNPSSCDCPLEIGGRVVTELGQGVVTGKVLCHLTPPPTAPFGPSTSVDYMKYLFSVKLASDAKLRVDRNSTNKNHLNGVSTLDLVDISKHILNIAPLGSPYRMLAADANRSGSITTFDIVELRKLILGVYDSLPQNTSWRFVPKSFVFPNPLNPFSAPVPDSMAFVTVVNNFYNQDFVGIKVGDVNNSVIPLTGAADERGIAWLDIPNEHIKRGEAADIPVFLRQDGALLGFQVGIDVVSEYTEILEIRSNLRGFGAENTHFSQDRLQVSWSDALPEGLLAQTPLFWLRLRAKRDMYVTDALRGLGGLPAESYDGDANVRDLQLRFSGEGADRTMPFISGPQPNPSSGDVSFFIGAMSEKSVPVQVFGTADGLVFSAAADLSGGDGRVVVPSSAFPSEGVFFWRVGPFSGKLLRVSAR
jgi:hypothetical protein